MRISLPRWGYLAGSGGQIERVTKLLLTHGSGQINFVPQDQEGHLAQLLNGQQALNMTIKGVTYRRPNDTFSSCLASSRRAGSAASTRKTIPEQSG